MAELQLPEHAGDVLGTGDIVRVFSAVTVSLPKDRQNKRIRVEGVDRHGPAVPVPPDPLRPRRAAADGGGLYGLAFRLV